MNKVRITTPNISKNVQYISPIQLFRSLAEKLKSADFSSKLVRLVDAVKSDRVKTKAEIEKLQQQVKDAEQRANTSAATPTTPVQTKIVQDPKLLQQLQEKDMIINELEAKVSNFIF